MARNSPSLVLLNRHFISAVDYCRLFAKQVEFEDALSTIAKRNEEQSQLQSRIAELERQLSNRDTQINK